MPLVVLFILLLLPGSALGECSIEHSLESFAKEIVTVDRNALKKKLPNLLPCAPNESKNLLAALKDGRLYTDDGFKVILKTPGKEEYLDLLTGAHAQGLNLKLVKVNNAIRRMLKKHINEQPGQTTVSRSVLSPKVKALLQNIFFGASLASILFLTALGLAVTFGLMGVINLAHGEMLMIGAYSTFIVSSLFSRYLPGYFELYLVIALPVAFFITAVFGYLIEKTVVRKLWGRPLETLLATWGISLILVQTVRILFGASNVKVVSPIWISGGVTITEGILFQTSRITCILLALVSAVAVWALFYRTRLGLWVRAIKDDRESAASVGIPVSKVDGITFALGSGLGGLAGVLLTQVANVGPLLGRAYLIDSFLIVVFGGIGSLIGTVTASLGLGTATKLLEPSIGAVLGKVAILTAVILFIVWRPKGLFPLHTREDFR